MQVLYAPHTLSLPMPEGQLVVEISGPACAGQPSCNSAWPQQKSKLETFCGCDLNRVSSNSGTEPSAVRVT